ALRLKVHIDDASFYSLLQRARKARVLELSSKFSANIPASQPYPTAQQLSPILTFSPSSSSVLPLRYNDFRH
ncbi:hypothetical protein CDV36_015897, partial [Fusarium kuroshium]